jgi:hypothetical protein
MSRRLGVISLPTIPVLVTVPPTIVDKDTSTDMVVRETANVTLTCKATGYPEPYVMWRREDGEDIFYNGENGKKYNSYNIKQNPGAKIMNFILVSACILRR